MVSKNKQREIVLNSIMTACKNMEYLESKELIDLELNHQKIENQYIKSFSSRHRIETTSKRHDTDIWSILSLDDITPLS